MKLIKIVVGLLLYAFNKNFRALVNSRRNKGLDDQVKHGETVIAILENQETKKRRIIK